MAKMLGQDILTQQEFDNFKINNYDPLLKLVEEVEACNVYSKKLTKIALIISAVSLIGNIGLLILITCTK